MIFLGSVIGEDIIEEEEEDYDQFSLTESSTVVEKFIRDKHLICYGGTAINNILPVEDQFYNKNVEIPDYDFFTPYAMEYAEKLANIYYKAGYQKCHKMSVTLCLSVLEKKSTQPLPGARLAPGWSE